MSINLINYNFPAILIIGNPDPEELRAGLSISPADYQILEDEPIKVAQVRETLHWLNLKPMSSGKKLLVIRNAENMETASANTILKTLEEPPSYAQIILTTQNEKNILSTIKSRCQTVRLNENLSEELPPLYLSPEQVAELSVKEKFEWVSSISELSQTDLKQLLTLWQIYYRQMMIKTGQVPAILKSLVRAKDLLQTNISVKLLLENLVLEITNNQETIINEISNSNDH